MSGDAASASVLTLVRDRTPQLRNLVRGLSRSAVPPHELVVARMGGEDPAPALDGAPFPVVVLDVDTAEGDLPLAAARNGAAAAASSDRLVFLDVDCIPGAALVGTYARGLDALDGVLMGAVRYLPPDAAEGDWIEEDLAEVGREHPARRAPRPAGAGGAGVALVPTKDHALLWSLSFAVRRTTFRERIGGFDPSFTGYGAEDTDLAFAARAVGVPLAWAPDALAFHQDHEHYDPPLHHLADIVANARRFRAKWGVWPMEGWLRAFAAAGLVAWEGEDLEVLRLPDDDERRAARRRTYPGG